MRRLGGGVAVLALSASAASAGPLYQGRFDGLRGDALNDGPFALYWNPAALARTGLAVGLHGTVLSRQARYDRDAALNDVSDEEAAANAGESEISTLGAIPAAAAAFGFEIGEDFLMGGGAGAYVLAAGVADWDKNLSAPAEHPGAVDGPQRWATIHTRFTALAASVGIAARHRPSKISFGFAPILAFGSLDTVRARNADRTDDLVDLDGRIKEGRILLESTDNAVLWVTGVRWEALPELTAALTYMRGATFEMKGDARIQFGTAPETTEAASINLPLASVLRAAVALKLSDAWTLRPQVEWQDWTVMERQEAVSQDRGDILLAIERDFDHVFAGRLRADFEVWPEQVTLHGGVGFETAATPDDTHEPGLAESENFEAGAGISLDFGPEVRLSASFIWHQFLDRRVTNSRQLPSVNGDYSDTRQYFTLDLEVR